MYVTIHWFVIVFKIFGYISCSALLLLFFPILSTLFLKEELSWVCICLLVSVLFLSYYTCFHFEVSTDFNHPLNMKEGKNASNCEVENSSPGATQSHLEEYQSHLLCLFDMLERKSERSPYSGWTISINQWACQALFQVRFFFFNLSFPLSLMPFIQLNFL